MTNAQPSTGQPAPASHAVPRPQVFALGIVRPTGNERVRGVFAPRSVASGEIVEVCPVVLLPGPFVALPPEIRRVTFPWGVLTGDGDSHAIAYGYGGIYNHANPANLRYAALADIGCLQFTAARAIADGEELTINFNSLSGDVASDTDTWFQALGLRPPE
jgi:hypothetical protein